MMRIRYLPVPVLICALVAACDPSQVSNTLATAKEDSLPIAMILLAIISVGMLAIKEKPDDVRAADPQTAEELDQIIRHYTQVIQQDPGYATAFFNRGLAYYSKDELELAIRDLDAAIRLIPADFEAYYYRGLAYLDKGEKEKAIADLKKAMELCGDSSEVLCLNAHSALEKLGFK